MPPSYLLEIRYVHRPPELREISAARQVIGRDGGDLPLGDGQTSAAHAEIDFSDGQVVVRDLGSTNGTWLGERRLPQFALSPGQTFRCGQTHFLLRSISGGHPLVAGRTILAEGPELGPSTATSSAPGAPPTGPGGPADGRGLPSQGPPPSSAGKGSSRGGLAVALAVIGVVVVGAVAFVGWKLFGGDVDDVVAEVEQDETTSAPTVAVIAPSEPGAAEVHPADPRDLGALYREVGAATVVIRAPGSVGSGVIIDDDGLILTNHHVVDAGTREGLNVKVKVVLGKYSEELRAFEAESEQRDAWVVKFDEEHDLALIRLVDPPQGLAALAIATENPYPGQPVAAVGHAGAGMLWAIKGGEVSATGSLAGHTDLVLDSGEASDEEQLRRMKRYWERKGRVLQSTTKILPGDSGGPLVDHAGEIVGINAFGRIDQATNQWLSFHVHLAEIRTFVANPPRRPVAMVPNPWHYGGPNSKLGDADLDGRRDVLLLAGSPTDVQGGYAAFVDLDQDSSIDGDDARALEELVDRRGFDAEFAALFESGKRHFWYDTNNDGSFDLYLRDEAGAGYDTDAYRLDAAGAADPDTSIDVANGVSGALFTAPALAERLARVVPVALPILGARTGEPSGVPALVDREVGALQSFDSDGDGRHDSVTEDSTFDQRYYLDLDQNSLPSLTTDSARKAAISQGTLDAEVVAVRQGSTLWLWYDGDDDGLRDLLLQARDAEAGIALHAWTIDARGSLGELPAAIGRLLLRPQLLARDDQRGRLRHAASTLFAGLPAAEDDGLGSFPSTAVGAAARVSLPRYEKFAGRVAIVDDDGTELKLLDLDGAPPAAGEAAADEAAVRTASFDPEFAALRRGSYEWTYYDRDDDGRFDFVVFSGAGTEATPVRSFEVDGSGAVRAAGSGGHVLRRVFAAVALNQAFASIAPRVFPLRSVD